MNKAKMVQIISRYKYQLLGGIVLIIIGIIGIFPHAKSDPLELIKAQFPQYDFTKWGKEPTPYSVRINTENGVTHVIVTQDPCSGVRCGLITCFDISNNKVALVGRDLGSVENFSEFPQYDFQNCKIVNKHVSDVTPIEPYITSTPTPVITDYPYAPEIIISRSPSQKYMVRYNESTQDPEAKVLLEQRDSLVILKGINDDFIRSSQVVWMKNESVVIIHYIDSDSGKSVSKIALYNTTNGQLLKTETLPNAFYGAAHDYAFPLAVSPDNQSIVVQSDYYKTFRIYNDQLTLVKLLNTQWYAITPFTEEMYAIPGYSMEISYAWDGNHIIRYEFKGNGAVKYAIAID